MDLKLLLGRALSLKMMNIFYTNSYLTNYDIYMSTVPILMIRSYILTKQYLIIKPITIWNYKKKH